MRTKNQLHTDVVRVKAPVDDPDGVVWSEVMAAAPDPADPDQAVLLNVPFLVEDLNFGDLVRLGPPDDAEVRPIVEVVVASGHSRVMAATEPGEARELAAELERMLPGYALRIEAAEDRLLAVSVHPDLDTEGVSAVVERWLSADAEDEEEGLAVTRVGASRPGPVRWSRSPLG